MRREGFAFQTARVSAAAKQIPSMALSPRFVLSTS